MKNNVKALLLGGLDEIGKVCIIVEINQQIFIFDAGIKKLIEVDLGINFLIPDFNYLLKNKARISGVFLSSANHNNIGSINFLLKKLPHLSVYSSELTKQILITKNDSNQNYANRFKTIGENGEKFNDIEIKPFAISAEMPGTVGYIIRFGNQQIIYTSSFLLNNDQNKIFNTNLKILFNRKYKTLLLIGNAKQSNYLGFAKPKNDLQIWIKKPLFDQSKKRIYLACFEDEWAKIFETLKILENHSEKTQIIFFDHKFGNWYQQNLGAYHQSKNLIFNKNDNKSTLRKMIFITGNEKWLFNRIRSLIHNKTHPLSLDFESYFFLLISRNYILNEINVFNLLNDLSTSETKIVFLNDKKVLPMIGANEDLRFLIKACQPKYFLPIDGYYQNLKKAAENVNDLIPNENILICENGEIIDFDFEAKSNKKRKIINLETVFIENNENKSLRESTINERIQLGENGILMIAFYYRVTNKIVDLISPLRINFLGIALNQTKKNKIIDQISNLISFRIKNHYTKDNLKIKNFKEKVTKEIELIIKKEAHIKPLIGLTCIEK